MIPTWILYPLAFLGLLVAAVHHFFRSLKGSRDVE